MIEETISKDDLFDRISAAELQTTIKTLRKALNWGYSDLEDFFMDASEKYDNWAEKFDIAKRSQTEIRKDQKKQKLFEKLKKEWAIKNDGICPKHKTPLLFPKKQGNIPDFGFFLYCPDCKYSKYYDYDIKTIYRQIAKKFDSIIKEKGLL